MAGVLQQDFPPLHFILWKITNRKSGKYRQVEAPSSMGKVRLMNAMSGVVALPASAPFNLILGAYRVRLQINKPCAFAPLR